MKTLTVPLPGKEYEIVIGSGLLRQAGERIRAVVPNARRLFIVTDSNVAPLYLGSLVESLKGAGFQVNSLSIPAGEASKSVEMLSKLWEVMMQVGMTRTDAVVALGGGVVGDGVGYCDDIALAGCGSTALNVASVIMPENVVTFFGDSGMSICGGEYGARVLFKEFVGNFGGVIINSGDFFTGYQMRPQSSAGLFDR